MIAHCFQQINERSIVLWLDHNATMTEIQRFVGIMGVFNAQGGTDPLRFTLTPKKALKAKLLFVSNITVIRPNPHPRFTHPTTGRSILRYSQAMFIAKKLQGIPEGEKLTLRHSFAGLHS